MFRLSGTHELHTKWLRREASRPRVCIYVCMYGHHIQQSMDQPDKVANPARGQLNRENDIPLSPCVPENLVSRDEFSRPVPRQPAHLVLTYGIPPEFRGGVHL